MAMPIRSPDHLECDQQREFEELFKNGIRYECSDSLWLSWLPLKLDIIELDISVIATVPQENTPDSIPKRLTKRRVSKPEGSARYDPQSPEWREIWEGQERERERVSSIGELYSSALLLSSNRG